MLTSISRGQHTRQALFIGLLFVPIFALMFLAGFFAGRSNEVIFPIAVAVAIMSIIGLLVTMGLNWRLGLYAIFYFVLWDRLTAFGETGNMSMTKVCIGLTVIFLFTAIFNNQLPGWYRRLADPLALLSFLYVAMAFASLAVARFPAEYGLEYVQRRFFIAVLLCMIIVAVKDRETFHRCVLALVIGGTMVAIATTSEAITGVGLLERLGRSNPERGSGLNTLQSYGGRFRLVGPSGDPPFYSLAQSLPGVLVFALLFYYREWWKKALLFVALGFIVFNIMGTGSRAGALAFAAGATMVFVLCPIKHRLSKAILFAAVGYLALTALVVLDTGVAADRIASPGEASRTMTYRTAMWQMAVDMWTDNPLVGVGTNGWFVYYHDYRIPGASPEFLRTHNAFLQLLAENGPIGVAVYLLINLFAIVSAFCAALATHDRRLKFEAMAFAACTVGFFLFAGSSNVLENELYFLVFGMCGASYHVYKSERLRPESVGDDRVEYAPKWRRLTFLKHRQNQMFPPGT